MELGSFKIATSRHCAKGTIPFRIGINAIDELSSSDREFSYHATQYIPINQRTTSSIIFTSSAVIQISNIGSVI